MIQLLMHNLKACQRKLGGGDSPEKYKQAARLVFDVREFCWNKCSLWVAFSLPEPRKKIKALMN